MHELQKIFKLVKKDLTFEISNLIEQISYSGLRYLFWLSIPLIYSNSISFIATLTIVNLLAASIYNSILGGPSFYKLSKLDTSQIKNSFTTIIISILILNFFSFIFFIAFYNHNLKLSEISFICLFPLITSLSDWNRKISILLKQNIKQLLKNIIGILLWIIFLISQNLDLLNTNYLIASYIFLIIFGVTNINYSYIKLDLSFSFKKYLESFNILKHYIVIAFITYLSGNFLFWVLKNDVLDLFIVYRNFLTPVIVFSLFIETHGAVKFLNSTNKKQILKGLILFIIMSTALFTLLVMFFLEYYLTDFNSVIFLIAALISLLVVLIKVPTVIIRLNNLDYILTKSYFLSSILLIPMYLLKDSLNYFGLEFIILIYLSTLIFILISLSKQQNLLKNDQGNSLY